MKKLLLLFILLSAYKTHAQEYLIKYDLLDGRTTYYKITPSQDTIGISRNKLKNSKNISLIVNNFNPFYWKASVIPIEPAVNEGAGSANVFNPFSVMGGGLGEIFSSMTKLELPFGATRGQAVTANDMYRNQLVQFRDKYSRLKEMSAYANKLQLLQNNLEKYKFNTN